MIPRSNILNMALSVIAKQTVTYYQESGRSVNDLGLYVTTYAAGVLMTGSFQPVEAELYQQYGLDFSRTYYTFYTPNNVLSVSRDISGDQIEFNGRRFQCESSNDWFAIDGWKGVLCVLIGDDTSASPMATSQRAVRNRMRAH